MKNFLSQCFSIEQSGIKVVGFILLLTLSLAVPVLAINTDSLGGNPLTKYLRSDVAHTTNGLLASSEEAVIDTFRYGDGTIWAYRGPGCLLYLPLVEHMRIHTDNTTSIVGLDIDAYANDINGSGIKLESFSRWSNGMKINHHGISNGKDTNTAAIKITCDNTGDGIRVDVGKATYGGFVAEGFSSQGQAGFAAFNNVGSGIYVDHGFRAIKPDLNSKGIYIENNNTGTMGFGYYGVNDYGCGNAWLMYLENRQNGSRLMKLNQLVPSMPALTIKGDSIGLSDSCLYYWWGMKGRKAEVETVKTSLCGRRAFGNGGQNLCDTMILAGVAGNTTVVTASYSGGFDAVTCTPLRIKVARDTIIVKRGLATDPDQYYWQAQKTINNSQIPPSFSSAGVQNCSPAVVLPVFVKLEQSYPNPAFTEANICYQVSQAGRISLAMYNMLGQKVKTLVDQWQPAGSYTVNWNGQDHQGQRCSAGIYFYKLNVDQAEMTKKLVLAR
ncbi:MAG: T9SS type A sorting domain-containing protein [bacterium]|nr:T9SS type A sorting domain-containing protein [bacterium]